MVRGTGRSFSFSWFRLTPTIGKDRTMVDSGSDSIVVNATAARCAEVATDFTRYPEWAKDVKEAVVLERDSDGRATMVEYRASALGRSTHFTLRYDYSQLPGRLSWHMVDGDIMRSIVGSYQFTENGATTRIDYGLEIELVLPLPGFVKRRAEKRILSTLKELKARIES
jgi:hypothetical protein